MSNARIRLLSALLALVFCVAPMAAASDPWGRSALDWNEKQKAEYMGLPVVSVATDATWPPMEYFNRDGVLQGFDIDLMREIGRRAGFRAEFESVPWDGIFIGLINGMYEVIASSVTILEERKERMLFSDPYLDAAQYVVVQKESDSLEQLEDLRGKDLGAQIGTTGARLGEQAGARVRTYDDLGLAIEDLVHGRLAGVVADVAIIEYYVLAHPEYGARLRVVDQPYAVEQYGFALRKDRRALRDSINDALGEIRSDGTLEKIGGYWFRHIDPNVR